MDNRDMRSNLLNEIFLGLADDATPVDAAIGLRVFNACIGRHLSQCGLETSGQFAAAKQFAHVGACSFVVNLDCPASGLMRGDRCSGFASFGIGLVFREREWSARSVSPTRAYLIAR